MHLGEQEPSLERRKQSRGEVVRVDAGGELAPGVQGSQPIADGGRPLVEAGRDERSGLGVALGQLPAEGAERAAPRHLADLRARSGLTTEQLIYTGRARGWLMVPSLEPR